MRLGILADTHMPGSTPALWPQLIRTFDGVDAILHAGDLHTAEVIDALTEIAPTYVARGNGDYDVQHPQLRDSWLLEFGGALIGMVHEFPYPGRAPEHKVRKRLTKHFAEVTPHVLIYGHTHHESVHERDDILYVNPGSPMLPRNQSTRLGTVGLLTIDTGRVDAQLYQLTETGPEPIEAPGY